ncbi:MAG: ABC transporter permease, partial [Gammaproteobacteria bacterium]|nr:ABC transporter permease [Gammaproteobacteria bacterium]
MRESKISTIAFYTFLEATRNRLVWLVVAFVVIGFGLSQFVSEIAITESATFQSSLLAAMLRFFAVFTISLFVITSMVREFDDKGLELVLSLPIPRYHYFLGKLLGFSLLAVMTAVFCGLVLLVNAPPGQVALWVFSLSCELLIITALSLLCLFTFSQITLALSAVMAFYLLSRSIEAMQLMARNPVVSANSWSQRLIEHFIDGVAFLLPDLARFTSSEWLVYHTGGWQDVAPIAGQSL